MVIHPKLVHVDVICFEWAITNVGLQCQVLLLIMCIVLQSTWYHLDGLIYWLIDFFLKWSLADRPTEQMSD